MTSKLPEAESSSELNMRKTHRRRKKSGPNRSRSWKPLKYPRSAFLREGIERQSSMSFFPFQRDVLLATVRELLIIEKRLDYSTLEVIPQEMDKDLKASEGTGDQHGISVNQDARKNTHPQPSMEYCFSAEELAESIVKSILRCELLPETEETATTHVRAAKRPRKVSEADQIVEEVTTDESVTQKREPEQPCCVEISSCFDLTRRRSDGGFPRLPGISPLPPMLHASISDENFLRASAVNLTQRLVEGFKGSSVQIFLGYKAPVVAQEKICQLLANIMFDVSHAMFAWIQTEGEILQAQPSLEDPDASIRKMLFCDQRSLRNVGGFMPHSLLPQAISICRLRRRGLAWAEFAKTSQGKRMFEHHGTLNRIFAVGKERRGQRLRQQHFLTIPELQTYDISPYTTSRPRSCSIPTDHGTLQPTHEEVEKPIDGADLTRTMAENSGSKFIALSRGSTEDSWGVALVQEGNACVVGKVQSPDSFLRCGDLILCVQGEGGAVAASPISSVAMASTDWFQHIVDIFRNCLDLQLLVKRA